MRFEFAGKPRSAENSRAMAQTPPFPADLPDRVALLGHRGAVLWLTGFSGAGKSTLATALERRLLKARVLTIVIDGDALRAGLCRDLGFSAEDRRENIRRAGELALQSAQAGLVAVVALISPFRSDRAAVAGRVRAHGVPFAEVFVDASVAECERRDPKGLYRRARAGELASFTGVDAPYEAPDAPALRLQTERDPVEHSVDALTALALRLAQPR